MKLLIVNQCVSNSQLLPRLGGGVEYQQLIFIEFTLKWNYVKLTSISTHNSTKKAGAPQRDACFSNCIKAKA